jgi:hypothetical protein
MAGSTSLSTPEDEVSVGLQQADAHTISGSLSAAAAGSSGQILVAVVRVSA